MPSAWLVINIIKVVLLTAPLRVLTVILECLEHMLTV